MQVLKEITEWADNTRNHIYWINDAGKMVAFENSFGRTEFKVPKSFDRARRKFIVLETIEEDLPKDARKVQGSNGKVYVVSDSKCTCPGFRFRGHCKHVKN